MFIRIRETAEVVTEITFRKRYRDRAIPRPVTQEWLDGFGADVVFNGPQATTTPPYEYSYQSGVEQQEDGNWYTKFSVGPVFADMTEEDGTVVTAAQQQADYEASVDARVAESVRGDRTKRLANCDWTQLADSPADATAWATYRQELRDITAHADFPYLSDEDWPAAPE